MARTASKFGFVECADLVSEQKYGAALRQFQQSVGKFLILRARRDEGKSRGNCSRSEVRSKKPLSKPWEMIGMLTFRESTTIRSILRVHSAAKIKAKCASLLPDRRCISVTNASTFARTSSPRTP